ncbi:MAG: hypothetical protein NTZ20_02285 [Candidatus Levybacteria bacterium]|nr:hypothetical protein [Candidatus Levybacteria bacterium]
MFPNNDRAKDLILQLTGFGVEKHDDLADAFSLLILKIIENDHRELQRCFESDQAIQETSNSAFPKRNC